MCRFAASEEIQHDFADSPGDDWRPFAAPDVLVAPAGISESEIHIMQLAGHHLETSRRLGPPSIIERFEIFPGRNRPRAATQILMMGEVLDQVHGPIDTAQQLRRPRAHQLHHHGLVGSARSIVDVLDINTACHHAIVDFDSNAELFGRVRLGLDAGSPLV